MGQGSLLRPSPCHPILPCQTSVRMIASVDYCLLWRWLSAPQPEAYSPHAYTVTAHRPIQAKEQLSQQLY